MRQHAHWPPTLKGVRHDEQTHTGGGGEVHHVYNENDGAAEVENLMNEIEVSFEVGGIDDA